MSSAECPIWKTPAELWESAGDYKTFDSPRAGGKHWISGSCLGQLVSLNDHAKGLLTTWLCEQRRAGVEEPRIRDSTLEALKSRQKLPVGTRMISTLIYLGSRIIQLGDRLGVDDDSSTNMLRLLAETESRTSDEVFELFRMLEKSGLVETSMHMSGGYFWPSVEGWRELDKLRRPLTDSAQAFVAMWFGAQTENAYVEGIEPALRAAGYKSVRIDKKEHNNKIDDEIIAEIRRSRFLIADFTCEPRNVRGGVYYEAGFAQGLGLPVIWTCKNTSLSDLHFDTRQYSHIVWQTPADLFVQLKNRIGATIGEGPLPKS